MMVGPFAGVCRRRGLKINAGKSKVMVLNGEDGLECEVHVEGIRLDDVTEFKYSGCVFDESGADGAECSRKVASGMRVADAIRSVVNANDFQLECVKVLHETLLVLFLMYGRDNVMAREGEI